jgi:N-methylhydantoinase A
MVPALAEAAVRRHVGEPGGLSLHAAAHGIHSVANSNMVRAIKSVSVERGRDPADFVMIAFGGAGPIHAAGVARALGMRQVLLPPAPGVFSAFGLLRAEVEHHAARTVLMPTRGGAPDRVTQALAAMTQEFHTRLREEGFDPDKAVFERLADLRYRGQSSELTVPMPDGPLTEAAIGTLEERFEAEFERTYGHRGGAKSFELVTVRLVLRIPRQVDHASAWAPELAAPPARRPVYFGADDGVLDTPVMARSALGTALMPGPLLVQEYDTTIVVPPGATACLDPHGNVLVALAPYGTAR